MERDPDYIDPEVLKRRADVSGGAGVESSRPRIRRVADAAGGVEVRTTSTLFDHVSASWPPVDVDGEEKVRISR